MDPNAAPLDVLKRSRLRSVLMVIGLFWCVSLAIIVRPFNVISLILIVVGLIIAVYFLFLEIQTIELFPTCLLLKYRLRQRRIERVDIDCVSLESRTGDMRGVASTRQFVRLKLRSGPNVDLGFFRIDINTVYEKLKAYESTN